jgi:hypothetical protein
MSVDRAAIPLDSAPVDGDLGKSIFPAFAVNVPLPADTVAPPPEPPAAAPSPPASPAADD